MGDKKRKNRQAKPQGSLHGMSKLTDQDVLEIRRRYRSSQETQQVIADAFGINNSLVSMIVTGKRWPHLPL